MEIYLVQHGEARSEAEDPERSLTEHGAEVVGKMATWASHLGIQPDQIRHSGKRRAEQTAEILAERLSPPQGVTATSGLRPHDEVRPLADALESEQASVMYVGHLPHLGRLAGLLVTGDADKPAVAFRNAGIVCLERGDGHWAVAWLMPPDLAEHLP
jgi:phosphohistidine phosphatase